MIKAAFVKHPPLARFLMVVCVLMGVSACSEETKEPAGTGTLDPLEIPEGCNPLAADVDCLLPYPSDVFLQDDPEMPSGKRVVYGQAAPITDDGELIDITSFYPADGFSHISPIMALFPQGVDASELVSHTRDVAASLEPSSKTLLIEADTGQPVLHFAEMDGLTEDTARRALFMRPMVRLKNQTRYVVAIQGLSDASGAEIEAPEGFRRLRDGQAAGDPVLEPLAERFEEAVFPVLADFGLEREGLVLAWEFTTQSMENVAGDMLDMRADLMERFEQAAPEVTITELTLDTTEFTARRVEGTLRVPLYIESDEEPNAPLVRDANGQVIANGHAEVPFRALIPYSALESDGPVRIVQFGHGFFSSRNELINNFIFELADILGFVVIAVDWWGLSSADTVPVGGNISAAPSQSLAFTDRLHQAMANAIATTYAVKGPLLELEAFQHEDGRPLYDPDQLYFYGISAGHILGATYLSLSPHIERAALGVGGGAFSFIMFRALPFLPLYYILETRVTDPLEAQKWATTLQTGFDRIDPITYAPHVLQDTFAGAPSERRVLMQIGIGDAMVPNLASHLHARALGLSLMTPAPRDVPGMEEVTGPFDGSALTEFDFGIDPLPGINAAFPEAGNVVHQGVRETPAGIEQIDAFWSDGAPIIHPCNDAPCQGQPR